MSRTPTTDPKLQSILVLCGPLSAFAMIAADRLGAHLTPGYSSTTQAISELVAVGAPSKDNVDPLLAVFHGLVIPFALGLHRELRPQGLAVMAPALLAAAGLAGVLLTFFFPCDPGCEPFISLRGTLHIFIAIPMGISVLVSVLWFSRLFRRRAGWSRFSGYTVVTAATGLGLAAATVLLAETDWVGLLERLLTLSYLQWYVVIGAVAAYRVLSEDRTANQSAHKDI